MAGLAEFEWDLIRDRVKSGPCGGQAARVQCRKRQAREMYARRGGFELLAYPTDIKSIQKKPNTIATGM